RTRASPSTGSPEREVTVTLSPSAANRRAMASPIPRFPPVTSTERPTLAYFPRSWSPTCPGGPVPPKGGLGGWAPQDRGGLGGVVPPGANIDSRRVNDRQSGIDAEFTALPL